MELEEMSSLFEKHGDDCGEFEKVLNPRSKRPDLHAFLLIAEMFPESERGIISAAEHDQIWLDVDEDELASICTEEQIVELTRCGVMYEEGMGLSMFR